MKRQRVRQLQGESFSRGSDSEEDEDNNEDSGSVEENLITRRNPPRAAKSSNHTGLPSNLGGYSR